MRKSMLKKNLMATFMFVLTAILMATSASAEPSTEMMTYLEKEISSLEEAIQKQPHSPIEQSSHLTTEDTTDERWYFQNFWLRIRPQGTFHVPGLVTFQVVPVFEILWQRAVPDGWTTSPQNHPGVHF